MNRLLFSTTVAACLVMPAFAADLPTDMSELNPQPLPPLEAVSDEALPEEETDSRVRITNETESDLLELYASPPGASNGQDVLGGASVSAGEAVTVDFGNESGQCEFDLRAVFDNGTEQAVDQLDACAVGGLSFTS